MLSGLIEGILLFDELKQPVDDYNLLEGFFEGYFGELSSEEKEISKQIWERMLMFVMNKLLKTKKSDLIHLVYDFCETERDKSYFDMYQPFIKKLNRSLSLSKEENAKIVAAFLKQKESIRDLHKM